jgi:hypothetical protein
MQLSGARPHTNRSYFISTHRFRPPINEDDDARPLQCKLDISRGEIAGNLLIRQSPVYWQFDRRNYRFAVLRSWQEMLMAIG